MTGDTLFGAARWLLRRLLVTLLALLFVTVVARQFVDGSPEVAQQAGSVTPPLVGVHHWHASYEVVICGERQEPFPFWPGGVHTHDDGIIHIHPVLPSEEGDGARLIKWFEYGGGELTLTSMRMPGSSRDLRNGDTCTDGAEGIVQVFVNSERQNDWTSYVPQDGDYVRIVFGPPE